MLGIASMTKQLDPRAEDSVGAAHTGARLMATALAAGVGVVAVIFGAFAYNYDARARALRTEEIAAHMSAVAASV